MSQLFAEFGVPAGGPPPLLPGADRRDEPYVAKAISGADNVARVLASIFPRLTAIDATVLPREINGQPSAIVYCSNMELRGLSWGYAAW